MANSKISALTSATTPLAGTETLPVVQSGATTQVSVANLTAGRAVSAASLALSTSPLPATSGGTGANSSFVNTGIAYASSTTTLNTSANLTWNGTSFTVTSAGRSISTTGTSVLFASNSATHTVFIGDNNYAYFKFVTLASPTYLSLQYNSTELIQFDSGGNLIPKVANTGINFTSNTPKAGMTSQLLNWYEEGTWTPTVVPGTGSLTAYTSAGTYTRIGSQVTIWFEFFITTAGTASGGFTITNAPFTVKNINANLQPTGLMRESNSTGVMYGAFMANNTTTIYGNALTGGAVVWLANYAYTSTLTYRT